MLNADALRNALERMDGHFIQGVGDGVVEAEIKPDEEALQQAKQFLQHADSAINSHIQRVANLIDGYQSPYGVELLSTVHWVIKNEGAQTPEQAFYLIQQWNERKKQLMTQQHVNAAWVQLAQQNWI
ncbi:hypothetical protein [Shewanella frigidimarina]|uniref:hypothetical protein n=1 Tax=Shewanella frigidimarina TaxID=56812 RepID=UPI000F4F2C4C|nr:hypothetical protein [Shewanella frigidimarina]